MSVNDVKYIAGFNDANMLFFQSSSNYVYVIMMMAYLKTYLFVQLLSNDVCT